MTSAASLAPNVDWIFLALREGGEIYSCKLVRDRVLLPCLSKGGANSDDFLVPMFLRESSLLLTTHFLSESLDVRIFLSYKEKTELFLEEGFDSYLLCSLFRSLQDLTI
jgi:hypothetical protein